MGERLREAEERLREERLREAEAEERLRRLREAAQHGRIDDFYTLIGEEANLLDRIDQVPFIHTPLHIAASVGQTQFAMEMVNLKPSFSRKLNQDGFSPMHLALQNGHHQVVLRLLAVDRDLVRVKGREGVTPLHFAAKQGLEKILAEFLVACPKSIQDLTIRNETALHIAAKNDMVEALKVLLGWLQKVDHRAILNWADDDGNTLLHIATNKNQIQVLKSIHRKVDLKAKNLEGLTALDIVERQRQLGNRRIRNMLRCAGAARASSLASVDTLEEFLNKFSLLDNLRIQVFRDGKKFTSEDRNAILVCAVLIATSTFQSVVNPLGGVWQNYNSSATITNATAATTTPGNGMGTSVDSTLLWVSFWFLNSAAFLYSVIFIYNQLGFFKYALTLYNILPLTMCYVLALLIVTQSSLPITNIVITIFVAVLVIKVVIDFYNRKRDGIRHVRSLLKRWPSFHREMAELT